jgi:hypothetical protein
MFVGGTGGLRARLRKNPLHHEMSHRALELADSCKQGNEPSGSKQRGEFLN